VWFMIFLVQCFNAAGLFRVSDEGPTTAIFA